MIHIDLIIYCLKEGNCQLKFYLYYNLILTLIGPVRTVRLKGLKAKFLAALNSKYLNLSSHCEKNFTLPIQR